MHLKIVGMKRLYEALIHAHYNEYSQMVFIMGPRQVGKTTTAQSIEANRNTFYYNWDDIQDRELILQGSQVIAENIQLDRIRDPLPLVVFDEIHKYTQWKAFVKGFYDHYKAQCHILVTGSSRLDVFKKGGDSLMGRYFYYRLHPLSVNELLRQPSPTQALLKTNEIQTPQKLSESKFQRLLLWGGFPEPYLKQDKRFYNRWSRLRTQQLLQEDIRELTQVQELKQLEMLAMLLKHQTGQLTSYTSLAKKVRTSVDTIRRWVIILESLYYCFTIRPWTKNVTRSILKEPKYYLWDWSQCADAGARHENFIASHLLKAVHFWTDQGLGNYEIYFLRDKEKREVDFLITKDDNPWFMVEAKTSASDSLSPHLSYFKKLLDVKHALQVAIDGDYVDQDVFSYERPVIVPAKTFLSQLV